MMQHSNLLGKKKKKSSEELITKRKSCTNPGTNWFYCIHKPGFKTKHFEIGKSLNHTLNQQSKVFYLYFQRLLSNRHTPIKPDFQSCATRHFILNRGTQPIITLFAFHFNTVPFLFHVKVDYLAVIICSVCCGSSIIWQIF